MRINQIPLALTYDDVLLVPKRSSISSRLDVNLSTYITPKIKIDFPLVAINMDTVSSYEMAKAMHEYGSTSFYPRFQTIEGNVKIVKKILHDGYSTIPTVGIKSTEFERAGLLIKAGAKVICVHVAHGHTDTTINMIKRIKKAYPKIEIIAGQVATYEGAKDLFEAGACRVRVGIGAGTICTTRKNTGCGVPNITASLMAVQAAKEKGGIIIIDGGTKTSGDLVKGLATGANVVIAGSQLAGTDEAPGEVKEINGVLYKSYNGDTSKTEKEKQYQNNKCDKHEKYVDFVEGVESYVEYKGSVMDVLRRLEAGIRSGFSYCNAKNIKQLHKNAEFVRVTPVSVVENGHHGVLKA